MKKFVSWLMVICFVFLSTGMVYASDIPSTSDDTPPLDYGDPVRVETYYDEESDAFITKKFYVSPIASNNSLERWTTSAWFKEEDTWVSSNGTGPSITYYAEGRFAWGDGDIIVTLPEGGNDCSIASLEVSDEKVTSGTKKPLIGKKYAYVTYSFKTKNKLNQFTSHSVTVKVDTEGNQL